MNKMNRKVKENLAIVFNIEERTFRLYAEDHIWLLPDHYIVIEHQEVELEIKSNISENDLVLKMIKTLEDKKQRIYAEAEKEANDINIKINKLKMLPYINEDII